ncbi:hypothetical protein E2C01_061418 [Portunus trituberculatus]|uniref:Uncharacterized protein n=1 Tax=Portunus trituberculatus TaxID=210409 RepID=A0A5B7HD51_PORTR|nr:hypothetical protein [Portunus trituberculatus]
MFKAAGRSLGQLSHLFPGGGARWCHWCPAGLLVDRRVAQAHVLTNSKWGAAPSASSPAQLASLHSGGLFQSSFESPVKCQQLRFYRWVYWTVTLSTYTCVCLPSRVIRERSLARIVSSP